MKAKKSLGQNFLMHQATADRIAGVAPITKEDTVLEIGPGTGMLTRALLVRAKRVVAVEADDELAPELMKTFRKAISEGNLELIHADIRSFDPSLLPSGYHIVANIPYYITGELIRTFLTTINKPASMTLLVQKEVAERIARSTKESLLSLSVKVYGTPRYCFTVPKGSFIPKPKVDSAVLSIRDISKETFSSIEEEQRFFEVLKAGFLHKRKLLMGNLSLKWSPEKVRSACKEAGIQDNARAEDVSLFAWRILAKMLAD